MSRLSSLFHPILFFLFFSFCSRNGIYDIIPIILSHFCSFYFFFLLRPNETLLRTKHLFKMAKNNLILIYKDSFDFSGGSSTFYRAGQCVWSSNSLLIQILALKWRITFSPAMSVKMESQTCLNAIFQILYHPVVKLPSSRFVCALHHDFELKALHDTTT